jgi:hypothetical protein
MQAGGNNVTGATVTVNGDLLTVTNLVSGCRTGHSNGSLVLIDGI